MSSQTAAADSSADVSVDDSVNGASAEPSIGAATAAPAPGGALTASLAESLGVAAGLESAPAAPAATLPRREGVVQTVGRRKEAIVRVRLIPGDGTFTLNGRTMDQYFPNKVHQQLIREPFVTLDQADSYDVIARLGGGGVTGQAGALRLAIARALIDINPDDRPALKKASFLTRDPRIKERKKYGLKKARKAPQYSKR